MKKNRLDPARQPDWDGGGTVYMFDESHYAKPSVEAGGFFRQKADGQEDRPWM